MDFFSKLYPFLDWISLTLIVFGLIGNFLTIKVFSDKSFAKSPLQIYGRALAVSDSLIILPSLLTYISLIFFNFSLITSSSLSCKLLTYFVDAFAPTSPWLIVLFATDTTISVSQPPSSKISNLFGQRRFKIASICFFFIFHILFSSPIPFGIDIMNVNSSQMNETITTCDIQDMFMVKSLAIVLSLESILVPVFIISLETIVIAWVLYKSQRNLKLSKSTGSTAASRRYRLVYNSIFCSIVFIISTSPLLVNVMFPLQDYVINVLFSKLAWLCFISNFSTRFVGYSVTNPIFRKRLLEILKPGGGVSKNSKYKA